MLTILPDGTLKPRTPGSTRITLQMGSLSADKEITIIEELPEFVKVAIEVKVPPATPASPMIYAGFEIPYSGEGIYREARWYRMVCLLRSRYREGLDCTRRSGIPAKRRSFTASSDLELFYEVEEWDV